MKIWAHRGCSLRYPENTMISFSKAMDIKKLHGIELDVQMTKDQELIVLHDERVDRTTNGIGYVKDYTLSELRKLRICSGSEFEERIPVLEEALDLLQDRMKKGLKLNIELKNSIIPYDGMEEKLVELVHKRGIEEKIVYSGFYAKSLKRIRHLAPGADIGILDSKVSDCLYKLKGGCGANALHPYAKAMDVKEKKLEGYDVRAWFTGYLYPSKPTGKILDIDKYENMGITDVFLNEPEVYLRES